MRQWDVLPYALMLALVGCTQPAATIGPKPMAGGVAAEPLSEPIRGVATYVERVKMPPGASLRVALLDAASGATVATTVVKDVGGPPIPFSIAPPAHRPAAGEALTAELVGPDGNRWFETAMPVGVPRRMQPVELRLRRVARDAVDGAPPPSGPALLAHWECGELGVMSRFDADDRSVRLAYNGRSLRLPRATSASGARYADGRGNEFWTKGATGHLTFVGEPARDCVQAAQASPWNEAALRGAAFRAVGNEPGWFVEVSSPPAVLDATLDYGEHRLHGPVARVPTGFEGERDGMPVRLRVERAECRDGMSGQAFEATVTLQARGATYRGCGAWLQD